MKIVDVRAHLLSAPLEQPFRTWSSREAHVRDSVVVEVTTDEGIVGWGECVCHGTQRGDTAQAFINRVFHPLLVGRDPFDVEVIWEDLYNASRPYGGGAAVNALSGVDIALWDVIGRATGKPIHKLIGGAFRSRVRAYATGFYRTRGATYPQASVDEAVDHVQNGFTAFKVKTGYGIVEDLTLLESVREAVGDEIAISIDANCAYDSRAAARFLRQAEGLSLHFAEELMRPDDLEGYQRLRGLTGTFITAGENLFSKFDFARWIEAQALDIYQPDVCSAGGFTEVKKIAAIAQAHHAWIVPHVWGTGLGQAAALHLLASLPGPSSSPCDNGFPQFELDRSEHPYRDELIGSTIGMEEGFVMVPDGPGLGVEVDRSVLEHFAA